MMRPKTIRLRLFVARAAPHSVAALSTLEDTLRTHPDVTAELEVVDVHEEPERALKQRVLVTPTLIRLSPKPELRVTGDLRAKAALLTLLDVSSG